MLVLCLIAILAISACNVAGQSCDYNPHFNEYGNGSLLAPATGLDACMAYCNTRDDCGYFDFETSSGKCWWLVTRPDVIPRSGFNFYIKICPDVRDVVSSPGNPECFSTNFPGPVSDLWASPNGVTWNFQVAHFGFDWPQTSIANLPASILVSIGEISFISSDNLDYLRVVVTQNNGNTITSQAIGPNDHSTTLSGANNVKRVDFYLAPVDFRRNVSLNDVNIKACAGVDPLKDCTIFNRVRGPIEAASLGIIRPGGTPGTFSGSVTQEYLFVELDLNCADIGIVAFSEVIFNGSQYINNVVIDVWNDEAVVPIVNKDGVAGDTFNNAQNITFASSVVGTRIRSTIIPSGVPNQGISGSISFSKYSVFAYKRLFQDGNT